MKKILYWIPAIAVMTVIFCFSMENGTESSAVSQGFGYHLIAIMDKIFNLSLQPDGYADLAGHLEVFIRKSAHFTEYMTLSMCFGLGLYQYNRITGIRLYSLMELLTVLYACSDEFHQLFVPGREGRFFDIFVDGMGGLAGVFVVLFVLHVSKKIRNAKV